MFPLLLLLPTLTALSDSKLVLDRPGVCPGIDPAICFCNKQLTSVNCEGHNLKTIPANLPKSVEHLYMAHNDLYSISFTENDVLPNLQNLYLDNNKVANLHSNTFSGVFTPKLKYLYLRNNKISVIKSSAFMNLSDLTEVYLVNNYIQKIEGDAFVDTLSVTILNLDGNYLSGIPPLGSLKNLQKLYIQANKMPDPTFPVEFENLRSITDIGLSNNNFQTIGDNTFKSLRNSQLKKMELSRNKISNISEDAFKWLKDIQSLKLGYNPLTSDDLEKAFNGLVGSSLVSLNIDSITLGGKLPSSTFASLRNTSITTLSMKNNKMSNIPNRGFADLKKLITLDLSAGGIFNISDSAFEGLDALTTLFLNDNQLSRIPNNLPPSLQKLYLNGNQISALTDKTLANLTKLQWLFLEKNKIHHLEQDSFYGLTSLKKLHLAQNSISTLPGKVFAPFGELESLELNSNNIKSIPNSASLFGPMSSLVYLNMANNFFSSCPLDLFGALNKLVYLHLEHNVLGGTIASDKDGDLFSGLTNLRLLNLTDNYINVIPDPLFKDLTKLQNLTLRGNKISTWGDPLFRRTGQLANLDLSQNMISLINSSSVRGFTSLKTFDLRQNPFACTCDLRTFRDFINSTKIHMVGVDTYLCNSPPDWHGKKLLSFSRTKINCVWFTKTQIILAAVGGFIFFSVIGFFVYRKRWFLQLRFYRIKRSVGKTFSSEDKRYERLEGDVFRYDAYISNSSDDYQWVLKELFPGIDNQSMDDVQYGGEFRLYFEDRDSVPGKACVVNMIENMETSRTVLIILTKTYISKEWHVFEIVTAMDLLQKGIIADLVIINVEGLSAKDVPRLLRRKMERHDFIEWENSEEAKLTFKEKLIDSLRRRRRVENII